MAGVWKRMQEGTQTGSAAEEIRYDFAGSAAGIDLQPVITA